MRAWDDHPEPRTGLCYTGKVNPGKISRLVALLEAYDGLATIRTKDAGLGVVEFWLSPFMQKDFESFLQAMQETMGLVWSGPRVITRDDLQVYVRRSVAKD